MTKQNPNIMMYNELPPTDSPVFSPVKRPPTAGIRSPSKVMTAPPPTMAMTPPPAGVKRKLEELNTPPPSAHAQAPSNSTII
eukprot:CAMPEP_0198118662 /NCGR_PEP_ID=MMETSP1442-20131203/22659_1 /TAXON_ID= /ORGANISM="Craspedostauros australis, Strain CCMP3328" /LENGTH=81 /DNA_ID=CAMNT_0043776967 /DNA_START=31 /DNA_END=276 /DNA_ORIENTATION=+